MNTPQQPRQPIFSHPAHCHLKSPEVAFYAITLRALSCPAHLFQNCTGAQVWVGLLWGHCSFPLGPGAQGSVCASKSLFPQSCVSSGSSLVGLMATSSKRPHAVPRSAEPRALPLQQATADPPVPPQETLRHSKAGLAQSPRVVLVRTGSV